MHVCASGQAITMPPFVIFDAKRLNNTITYIMTID